MPNGMPTQMAPIGNALQRPMGGNPPFNVAQHVEQNWQAAQAQHRQLLQSQQRMTAGRGVLDSLMKLGDTVQVEDVIKGAGTLVGKGFSPMAIAQMLSSMPTTGGQAMQAWIQQLDQSVQGMEAQLRQNVKSSAIHRGLAAMASLHVGHIKSQLGGGPPPQMGGAPPSIGGGALGPQSMPEQGEGEEEGED